MLGSRQAKNGTGETHPKGHPAGTDHTPLPTRIWSVLPVFLLMAILLVNTLCSRFDGTGKPSIVDELPTVTTALKNVFSANKESVSADDDSEDDGPYFQMTISSDTRTVVDFNGSHIDGYIMKEWDKGKDTCYFVYDSSPAQTDIDDGETPTPRFYLRIIQPSTQYWTTAPNRWAWILHSTTDDAVWSNWFKLNPDGSAVVGCGTLDFERATEASIKRAETPATWRFVDEANPHTISVKTKKEGYLISFEPIGA